MCKNWKSLDFTFFLSRINLFIKHEEIRKMDVNDYKFKLY